MRIPCVILCFYDFSAIKASLEFFMKFKDKLELIVIENPSKYTEKIIKPFILDLVNTQKIDSYYLMDENISLNAVELLLNLNVSNWKESKYIINCEGDICSDSITWIEEELNIMEKYPEVLACGLGVDLEACKKIDGRGAYWYPLPDADRDDYFQALTGGGHVVMWRTNEMQLFLNHIKQIQGRFIDNYMHPFRLMLGKQWARTKISLIRHFSWEYQIIDNHEYHEIKKTIPWVELFHHSKYCGYTLYTLNESKKYTVDGLYIS